MAGAVDDVLKPALHLIASPTVHGKDRLAGLDPPAIFVANHQSSLDIPVLGRLLERDFTIVAKKEARWDPRAVVGSVVIDPAYIDRSDSASARATLDGVVERIRGGTSLMIFPEGTRSATPVLGPFRKGSFHLAAQAGVPFVPVVLRNTGELMRRGSLVLNPGVVDVCVLEPETDWEVDRMGERIAALHAKFEATLGKSGVDTPEPPQMDPCSANS